MSDRDDTTSPETPRAIKAAKKVSCCGPIGSRVSLIKQVAQSLAQGHNGIAVMYEQLAKDFAAEGDSQKYMDAAARQRKMAEDSLIITVPDELADEE